MPASRSARLHGDLIIIALSVLSRVCIERIGGATRGMEFSDNFWRYLFVIPSQRCVDINDLDESICFVESYRAEVYPLRAQSYLTYLIM